MDTLDNARLEQAQNFINICKNAPLGTIVKALQLQTHQFEYIAHILGCKPELNSIAYTLINTR